VKTGSLPLVAVQGDSPYSVYVKNQNTTDVAANVSVWKDGNYQTINTTIKPNECKFVQVTNNILTADTTQFPAGYRNIARGKQVMADDQWPEHFPFAMIDEVDSTYYQSIILPTAVAPENLTIRLWGLYACNKLTVHSVEGIGPKEIMIQTSSDGTTFTTVKTATLSNTTDVQQIDFPESDAKYVRIKVNSTFGSKNVGISSIQLFGYPK